MVTVTCMKTHGPLGYKTNRKHMCRVLVGVVVTQGAPSAQALPTPAITASSNGALGS